MVRQPDRKERAFPIIGFTIVMLGLFTLAKYLGIPVGNLLLSAYQHSGRSSYLIVFAAAFLEGLFVINIYVPGSAVVILAAVASRIGILNIWGVIGTAWIGFSCAYIVCFSLGYSGSHTALSLYGANAAIQQMYSKMQRVGPIVICAANIHPNIGALAAVVSGMLRLPFRKFLALSTMSALFWNILWGMIAYHLGDKALLFFNSWLLVPVLMVIIGIVAFGRSKKRHQPKSGH
ncbi:MAG: DedA family protein [Armatimonadota bacterium]